MFDSNRQYEIRIPSGTMKKCVLRFPSDQELIERTRAQKTIRRQVGRNTETSAPGAPAVNLELFQKIRIDTDGQSFDEHEATAALARLERIEILDCERAGDTFTVRMNVPGGEVTHALRMPTQADISAYARSSVRRQEGRREVTTVVDLAPAGALWQKLAAGTTGYAEGSAVPICHQDAALVEVLSEIDRATEDADPE